MDPSTNFSLTQLIIIWTLLGFLLTWMVVFAVLAIRCRSRETVHQQDAPSESLHAISSILPKLHLATTQSAETANVESTMPSEVVVRS